MRNTGRSGVATGVARAGAGRPGPTPDPEALAVFLAELRGARQRFVEANDPAGARIGVRMAVTAVLGFIRQLEPVRHEMLQAPLARLLSDLIALDFGNISPLLEPSRPKGGRVRASPLHDIVRGSAVSCVVRLRVTGLSAAEAREKTANVLRKSGVRPGRKGSNNGGGIVDERTLRGWQERIAADAGCVFAIQYRAAEAAHRELALERLGLLEFPEGSDPANALLKHYPADKLREGYLNGLAAMIAALRGWQESA
jgi:hypothetical protein